MSPKQKRRPRRQTYLRGETPIIVLANRLRELRAVKWMTQAALAHRAKVSRTTIVELENGEGDPRFSTLLGIAKTLGVTLSELLRMDP